MRKIALGRFPEMDIEKARREAATVLARLWGGEAGSPPARRRRRYLIPHFWTLGLDTIDHARVSVWFDEASIDRPGARPNAPSRSCAPCSPPPASGAELGAHIPDACANIVKNPRRPVARYLDRDELERLGAVLDRHREQHPWPVAAIRLLTHTGTRLSEVINLK